MNLERVVLRTAEVMAAPIPSLQADVERVQGLEATIRRRDAVLAAVSFGASRFLSTEDWDRDIRDVLARLGAAAEVTRAYLFEGSRVDGALHVTMRHEWIVEGAAPLRHDPTREEIDIVAVGLSRWEALERGETIHGPLDSMPPSERAYFERIGVRSVAAVPVFAGDAWWGYFGLADDTAGREWSRSVLEAIQAAAATVGAAIYRKKAEEKLRESRELYRLLTEAAFEGVLINCEGVLVEANLALSRILGYDFEDLAGRNVLDFVPTPESRQRIKEHVEAGSEERYEITLQRKDGGLVTAEVSGRNIMYKGKPARVSTINDVTDRNRAEVELRRRQSQLAEAQAIAHMGSWDWDLENNELTGSDEVYRIYGFADGTKIGTSAILERIHPDDAALVRRTLDEAVQLGRSFSIEHRIIRGAEPDDVRLIRSEGRVLKNAEGAVVRLVGANHDITERRKSEMVARELIEEQAAREGAEASERRAAFLSEASRVLGSSFDYHTTITALTRLAVPTLGDYCTFDIVGKEGGLERVAVAHVDPNKEPLLWELTRWLQPDRPIVEHLRKPLFDGQSVMISEFTDAMLVKMQIDEDHGRIVQTILPRSCVSVPVMTGGKILGSLALYASESGRRFGPNELALAQELARRAALAVENARLFREAEQATQARDQMLGIVAHDLRNPLGTILMASELLNEVLEPESPSRRQVAMVKRAVDRMNRLIGDLLDAKRLEHGKLAVEPRPVPPQPILAEAVEMLRGVAAASKVDLVLDASTELPVVMADANRIQQVLSNLIGNGIKFTPPGGTITVRGEKAMGGVRIAVADTGAGIPVDQLGHIFGRFWQGSRTDKRGIGLGLAIAKGLVEAHEGKIWVESTVGTGTTFYFTLPVQ